MSLWRCYHEDCATEGPAGRLGFDFEAPEDSPTCPRCHSDGMLPEHKALIVPLAVHHYLHRDARGPIVTDKGRLRLACSDTQGLGHNVHATRETAVVNCPVCKTTPAFAEADKLARRRTPGVHPEGDREVRFTADPTDTRSHPAPGAAL